MGLDTTHDCWHGSYSSFGAWRRQVALAAGYGLDSEKDDLLIWQWTGVQEAAGTWATPPDDPLLYLLCHSDCDGVLPVSSLRPLARRLDEIAPRLRETDQALARVFADGLRDAAAKNEPVEFR